jgi:hypothetical protein
MGRADDSLASSLFPRNTTSPKPPLGSGLVMRVPTDVGLVRTVGGGSWFRQSGFSRIGDGTSGNPLGRFPRLSLSHSLSEPMIPLLVYAGRTSEGIDGILRRAYQRARHGHAGGRYRRSGVRRCIALPDRRPGAVDSARQNPRGHDCCQLGRHRYVGCGPTVRRRMGLGPLRPVIGAHAAGGGDPERVVSQFDFRPQ